MSFWYGDEAEPLVPPAQRRTPAAPDMGFLEAAGDAYAASRDLATYVDNTAGRANAIEEAYDRRIDAVLQATGVRLDNPLREATPPGQWLARARELDLPADAGPAAAREALIGRAEQDFAARLRELADGLPDFDRAKRAAIAADRPVYEDALAIGRDAAHRAAEAAPGRPVTGFVAGLAGGLAGSFRDPLNVGVAAATGPVGFARTGGWLVLRNILGDAVVNAAGEAALQPAIMAWRRELGLEAGLSEAAANVGAAALFGGAIRAGIETPGVVRGFLRGSEGAAGPLRTPQAATADVPATTLAENSNAAVGPAEAPPPTILSALEGDEEAMIRAAREAGDALDPAALAAAEALEADRLLRGLAPEGMAEADHARNFAQAVRFAEDPADELPALPFDPVPATRAEAPPLPDVAAGHRFDYLKKPVTFAPVDAARLGTDAATFQYKGGGDAAGVTERLRSVTRWDNLASGKIVVFERGDGSGVIADGHQRLGLAQRLLAEGREQKIELNAFIFREADGWTPADVRAIAAKKNLQEGSGDVVDTARVLRERPTILDGSVPTGSEHMRHARGLARLSDEAFGMVVNGRLAPNHAAVVGEMMPDKALHSAAVEMLAGAEDLTTSRARFMVADMARVPTRVEVQETLLGIFERTIPLVAERARVLDKALGVLRREKGAFRTVLAARQALEGAGNVIEEAGSREAIDAAGEAIAAIEKLALRHGPISGALDRAAQALSNGRRISDATDDFVREVTAMVDERGLVALATEEAPPARVAMDDPTGAEATAQADALYGDLYSGEQRNSRSSAVSAAVKRLDQAVQKYDAVPMDDAPARRAAMAELDAAEAALRDAAGAGLAESDPRMNRLGELSNIIRRDLPAAREGRQIGSAPIDDVAELEARRDEIIQDLTSPAAERRILDDVTHSEDLFLGLKQCAMGGVDG